MTKPPDVLVVPTGTANLAAVIACFRRLGAEAAVSCDADRIAEADRVVLPGVGAFEPAWTALSSSGAAQALRERISADRATLGICLGMQLLAEGSTESNVPGGLGILPGQATEFDPTVRVPLMGWNQVHAPEGARCLTTGYAYFANSYRLPVPDDDAGWVVATTDHGGYFWSAAERGRTLACQFHPELSGAFGAGLVQRWSEGAGC